MTNQRFQGVKAYNNPGFMNSREARVLRIMAEYLEPEARFRELGIRDTIVVFGSARIVSREQATERLETARKAGAAKEELARLERLVGMSRYYEETRELTKRLTQWSKELTESERRFVICSGGGPGIMEAANRGASEARGENIGLNISLPFEQHENPYITRRLSFEFHYFFLRKFWFSYLAKAFVIMPGGFGTLDEFLEVLTLIQTLKIKKKVGIVLYGRDYWERILNFEPMIDAGTISPGDLDLFHFSDSVDESFQFITTWLKKYAMDDDAPKDVYVRDGEAPPAS